MQTHLTRRGGRYSLRRRIPLDLVPHYNGRKEIVKALGTSERREAEQLVRSLSTQLDAEFAALRMQLQSSKNLAHEQSDAENWHSLDLGETGEQDAQKPANIQMLSSHAPSPDALIAAEARTEVERLKREILRQRITGNLSDFMTMERLRLANNRAALSGAEESTYPEWKLKAVILAQQEVLEPGQHPPIKWLPMTQPAASMQAVAHSADAGQPVTLPKLLQLWCKDGSHSNVRTIEKAELVVRRFQEMVGDLPVQAITRKHCITFRDSIRASGKSISTTNDHMDKLRALLSVAKSRDLIQQNPAEGCTLKDPIPQKEKRKPFNTAALVRIFGSSVYTSGFRQAGGAGEAAYWLPLLALFTGARLEELGQLRPEDLYSESYEGTDGKAEAAWVIRITDEGEGQRLKNPGSRRRIPVHAELVRLGFIEFVEQRRGKSRIFYELQEDTRGRETGLWSKWFGRWLRGKQCGVTDKRMVFHSFRHTFKDLCRDAGIDAEVSDALTGHSGEGSVSRDYGSDKYPLRPLVLGMKKLTVPAEVQRVLTVIQRRNTP